MKQNKTIIRTFKEYGKDWPPEDATGLLAWFQSELDDVPAEFRDKARIDITSEEVYESSKAIIEISYDRPETDEEMQERERFALAQQEQRRVSDLRTLARLQAEYGKLFE
jgi:hypothetical protein